MNPEKEELANNVSDSVAKLAKAEIQVNIVW